MISTSQLAISTDPTPAQIACRAAIIRSRWTDAERRMRAASTSGLGKGAKRIPKLIERSLELRDFSGERFSM